MEQPTDCPAGRYGSEMGLSDAACSGECARGFFCPAGSMGAKAEACAEGTFGNASGLVAQANCTACPEGHSCGLGASRPASCAAGTVANATGMAMCLPCEAGTYQDEEGTERRQSCTIS